MARDRIVARTKPRAFRRRTFHRGRRYDAADPRGEVVTYWGRYRVEPGENGAATDRVAVETDAGEKIRLELIDGRRNLVWGTTLYGQVDWENEALRRTRAKPE